MYDSIKLTTQCRFQFKLKVGGQFHRFSHKMYKSTVKQSIFQYE